MYYCTSLQDCVAYTQYISMAQMAIAYILVNGCIVLQTFYHEKGAMCDINFIVGGVVSF